MPTCCASLRSSMVPFLYVGSCLGSATLFPSFGVCSRFFTVLCLASVAAAFNMWIHWFPLLLSGRLGSTVPVSPLRAAVDVLRRSGV